MKQTIYKSPALKWIGELYRGGIPLNEDIIQKNLQLENLKQDLEGIVGEMNTKVLLDASNLLIPVTNQPFCQELMLSLGGVKTRANVIVRAIRYSIVKSLPLPSSYEEMYMDDFYVIAVAVITKRKSAERAIRNYFILKGWDEQEQQTGMMALDLK
ncbi:hypothetical protein HYW20_02775 [Candidatus Woesearchaeota archaeon]|nr:hypothetical protein [Candidatus Woesearchaeota archaeon]